MKGYFNGVDFVNLDCMRYYAPPNSWGSQKAHDTAYSRIFSGDWIGSRKMDGFLERFVKDEDGNMFLLSRSKNVKGEYPNKIEWVPQLQSFFDELPNGTCLLGEVYFPNNEGSKNVTSILGCLKEKAIARQTKGDPLYFYIFDVLGYDGVNLMNEPIEKRIQYLNQLETTNQFIKKAYYTSGEDLWNLLQETLANGGEGIVITHKYCKYQPGKRPSKETLKCKKELTDTIDCFVCGANPPTRLYTGKEIEKWQYWENLRTGEKIQGVLYKQYKNGEPIEPITKNYFHKWAGSLKIGVYKDNKVVEIGSLSGLTDYVLENWRDYVGKVCEIAGMEIFRDSDGCFSGVRHPRLIDWREDKNVKECRWEDING